MLQRLHTKRANHYKNETRFIDYTYVGRGALKISVRRRLNPIVLEFRLGQVYVWMGLFKRLETTYSNVFWTHYVET